RSGGPRAQHGLLLLREIGEHRQNLPYLEIAIRPPIEPVSDTRREGVIDRRMAQRARNADARDVTILVDRRPDAHDRVFPQQFFRAAHAKRIVQQEFRDVEPAEIDFQPEGQRFERRDLMFDDLVESGSIGPELLIAERVIAENLLSLAFEIVREFRRGKLMAGDGHETHREERRQRDGTAHCSPRGSGPLTAYLCGERMRYWS